jgi:hypothetical protein
MAFDQPRVRTEFPASFEALYVQWRTALQKTKGEPLLEFVTWVETTLGEKICDLGTEADMQRLRAALVARGGTDPAVGEMIWEGLEGGP